MLNWPKSSCFSREFDCATKKPLVTDMEKLALRRKLRWGINLYEIMIATIYDMIVKLVKLINDTFVFSSMVSTI